MCLTGVDYFSTLGYQPGIAFLAAGVLSPAGHPRPGAGDAVRGPARLRAGRVATARTARAASSCSRSSCRAGRARPSCSSSSGSRFTDFIITITLSAADATAHIIENPFVPAVLHHQVGGDPGAARRAWARSSCRGFREAIGLRRPHRGHLPRPQRRPARPSPVRERPAPSRSLLAALAGGPVRDATQLRCRDDRAARCSSSRKLALGLSGFETGVAVMPLVQRRRRRRPGAARAAASATRASC